MQNRRDFLKTAAFAALGSGMDMKVMVGCMTYTLTVDTNAVPAGKMLRCWLPFAASAVSPHVSKADS